MSRKPKTRFQLIVDGTPKELFSIRSRAPDQLVILTPQQINVEWDGDEIFKEHHISVHGGETGRGATIKNTTKFGDNKTIENAAFMYHNPQGWCSVAYAKACQNMAASRYNLKPGPRDTIINVASHKTRSSTFLYAVVVSDKPWPIRDIGLHCPNFCFVDFERFSVGCLFSFQNIPSSPLAQTIIMATSTQRYNGGDYHQYPQDVRSFPPEIVVGLAAMQMELAAHGNAQRIAKLFSSAGVEIDYGNDAVSITDFPIKDIE